MSQRGFTSVYMLAILVAVGASASDEFDRRSIVQTAAPEFRTPSLLQKKAGPEATEYVVSDEDGAVPSREQARPTLEQQSSSWPSVGTGVCNTRPVSQKAKASKDECQSLCQGDCNYYCFGDRSPGLQDCFTFADCTGFDEKMRGNDASMFTCYKNPSATPCDAPDVDGASKRGVCAEGKSMAPGGKCTTSCMPGYDASAKFLTCNRGSFSPNDFKCVARGCTAPDRGTIDKVGRGQGCLEGKSISSGSQCTPNCRTGYVPSFSSLSCLAGALSPPSYKCVEAGCQAPTVANAHANGACLEGANIRNGDKCTPRCADGHVVYIRGSAEEVLQCSTGKLSPPAFTCVVPLPIPAPGIKRGVPIGYSRNSVNHLKRYPPSKIGWWYNWRPNVSKPTTWTSPTNREALANRHYIPMIQKKEDLEQTTLDKVFVGSPYLMGFNEPYGPVTNLSPQDVADNWHILERKRAELSQAIGSTVEIVSPTVSPKTEGQHWADKLEALIEPYHMNFSHLSVHYYTCEADKLKKELDGLYEQFQKPIWLTEFNCGDGPMNADLETHMAYMKQALPILEKHPYVTRYAWMASTSPVKGASLVDTSEKLTKIGRFYVNYPAYSPTSQST